MYIHRDRRCLSLLHIFCPCVCTPTHLKQVLRLLSLSTFATCVHVYSDRERERERLSSVFFHKDSYLSFLCTSLSTRLLLSISISRSFSLCAGSSGGFLVLLLEARVRSFLRFFFSSGSLLRVVLLHICSALCVFLVVYVQLVD